MARLRVLATLAAMALVCFVNTAQAQTFCEGMDVRITASRKEARTSPTALANLQGKAGQRVKLYVTVINRNTTLNLESALVSVNLPDGVAYLKAKPQKNGAGNSTLRPTLTNLGLMWRGIGPLPAVGSGGKARADGKSANTWTQGLELWLQDCAPSSEVVISVFGVATLSGGDGTCDLVSWPANLVIQPNKKVLCADPPGMLNVGQPCTQDYQCSGDRRSACINGACVAAVSAVGQPCTQDDQCGSGNNCINGVCQYCARRYQQCQPPGFCPGENEKCESRYCDASGIECGGFRKPTALCFCRNYW